jgi:integrase
MAEGLCVSNPAEHLKVALQERRPKRPQAALLDIEECRSLLAKCDRVEARASTKLASRFLALTAVRLNEVRGARWGEIQGFDGPAPLWRVPPTRVKLTRAKKTESRFAHLVPLSAAAVAVLRAARTQIHEREVTDEILIFPGRGYDPSHAERARPIGEGAIGELYSRAGFRGRHVPHGWRASFSTILNEHLGEEWSSVVDRALAHMPSDRDAAYNRSQQIERRRVVMERWARLLMGNVSDAGAE